MSDKLIERWNKLAGVLTEGAEEEFDPKANTAIGARLKADTGVSYRPTEKVTDTGLLRSRAGSGGQKQAEIVLTKLLERNGIKPTIDIAGISASGTPDVGIRLDRGQNAALFSGLQGRSHAATDFPIYGAFQGWAIEVKAGGSATIDTGAPNKTIYESIRHEDGFIFFNKGNSRCKIVIFERELYDFLRASPLWSQYGAYVGFHNSRQEFSKLLGRDRVGDKRGTRYEVMIQIKNMPTGVQLNPDGSDGPPAVESNYVEAEGGWGENPVIPYIAQVCDAYDDNSQMAALNTLFDNDQTLIDRWIRTCRTFNKDGHSAVPVFLYSDKVWPWISNITPEKAQEKAQLANAFLNRNAAKILKRFFGYTAAQLSEGGVAPLALLSNASNKVLQLPVKKVIKKGRKRVVTHYNSIDDIMNLSAGAFQGSELVVPSGRSKNIALPKNFVAAFKKICQEAYDTCIKERDKALISIARVNAFSTRMKSSEILGVDENGKVNLSGAWWSACERRANDRTNYAFFDGQNASFWDGSTTVAPPPRDSTGKGTVVGALGQEDETPPDELKLTPQEEAEVANTEQEVAKEAETDTTTADAMLALKSSATEELVEASLETGFRGLSGKGARTKQEAFVTAMMGGRNPRRKRSWASAQPRLQQIAGNIDSATREELNAIVTLLGDLKMPNGDLKLYITAKFSPKESKNRSIKYMLLEMLDSALENNAANEISALLSIDAEQKFEALDAEDESQSGLFVAHRKRKYSITAKLLNKK